MVGIYLNSWKAQDYSSAGRQEEGKKRAALGLPQRKEKMKTNRKNLIQLVHIYFSFCMKRVKELHLPPRDTSYPRACCLVLSLLRRCSQLLHTQAATGQTLTGTDQLTSLETRQGYDRWEYGPIYFAKEGCSAKQALLRNVWTKCI